MTPRALLTTIGATALAFAMAIGIAADHSTGMTTAPATVAPSTGETATDNGISNARLAAWNDPCIIAV